MSITATQVGNLPYYIHGNKKRTITDITFDADYATGGEPVTAAQLRLSAIQHAEAQITVASNADDALGPTATALVQTGGGSVLVKLWDKTPAEITADDDVSACVVRVIATGY